MIEHLTELVKELNNRGYNWDFPIEVERELVRVRGGRFGEETFDISKKGDKFEISLVIMEEDGIVYEETPDERQTIEQVVDCIM